MVRRCGVSVQLLVGLGQDQLEDEFVDRSSRTLSCAATPRAFLWLLEVHKIRQH